MYRGIDNGRRVKKKIPYSPVLFLPTNKSTEWSGLHGEKLEPKKFETIREARDFIKMRLDEMERDELVRLKKIRAKAQAK